MAATKRKMTTKSQIFGSVSGETHWTATKIATTSARQIITGRQNGLTRKTELLLFVGCAFALEHIARAADRFEEGGMVGVGFHFFAQAADVDVHAARRHKTLGAPNGVEQLIACEHAVGARREIVKQAKLKRGKRDRLAVARDAVGGRIDRQAARLDHAPRLVGRLGAAQQRLHSGAQLARAEGLRDVVVRAHFEAHHAVGLLAARRQHQDWQAVQRSVPANFLADIEAGKLRQHQVEEQNVRRRFANLRESRGPIRRRGHLKTFALEVVAHELHDVPVVFNEQNSFHSYAPGFGWSRPVTNALYYTGPGEGYVTGRLKENTPKRPVYSLCSAPGECYSAVNALCIGPGAR